MGDCGPKVMMLAAAEHVYTSICLIHDTSRQALVVFVAVERTYVRT